MAPVAVIQNLLDVQHTMYPGHNNEWDQILEELATAAPDDEHFASSATFCFLTLDVVLPHVSVQLESSIFEMPWQMIGWVTKTAHLIGKDGRMRR